MLRELEAEMAAAEKANLAKTDFLSSMSHELRTPLNAILGFAQLMESGTPARRPRRKRNIDQILKAGWYLLELINDILDLALIESGKVSLSLERSRCRGHARMPGHDRAAGAEARHQHDVSAVRAPCFVKADRTRLKQVLINLLFNAIKYNRAGRRGQPWNCAP
jgi:signal transduction histidine kinase